jgi:N-formylglutamate amidohydrolase
VDENNGFGPMIVSDERFTLSASGHFASPILFNSPHSGSAYSEAFLKAVALDQHRLRRSEDIAVDQLFRPVVEKGHALFTAHFPRAFVDVNREPYELDPRMFEDDLPDYANTKSLRVSAGLGTIARVVADGEEIYAHRLSVSEAMARIETFYHPYHEALADILLHLKTRHGFAVLVDCHSMPTLSAYSQERRADIVIGNRFEKSCDPLFCEVIETSLKASGYKVVRNKPFAGGFITEHYGRPQQGLHAIQIEISRALYMDERTYQPTAGFLSLQDDLMMMVDQLAEAVGLIRPERGLAAE